MPSEIMNNGRRPYSLYCVRADEHGDETYRICALKDVPFMANQQRRQR